MSHAATFALPAPDVRALNRPLQEAARQVPRPTAGFVFLTGPIARDRVAVARAAKAAWPGVPTVVVSGAGVLNEQGEFEGQSAAAGMLVSGVSVSPLYASGQPEEVAEGLGHQIDRAGSGGQTALLFFSPLATSPLSLDALTAGRPRLRLLGGGTVNNEAPALVDAEGQIREGSAAGLLVRGPGPLVTVSPGCRLIGRLSTITETKGAMVLSLDGEPALEALSRAAEVLEGRPLVLAIVPDQTASAEDLIRHPLQRARVRPVRGVDPGKKGIVLGEVLQPGDRIGFAVLDGPAARTHLDHQLRDLGRETAGAALRFGLYVNCAGRGAGLHGNPSADIKIIRNRFAQLPFAGLMASFEIAPVPRPATTHFYTGAFGLFTAPS
jgi:small ligand-binding sensory domain FIST